MKQNRRRLLAVLLAAVLLAGLLPMAAWAAPSGYTTDSNELMAYGEKSYTPAGTGGSTDVQGNYKGRWIQTTFNSQGYGFVVKDGLTKENVSTDCQIINGGRYVQLNYTVTAGDSAVTDGKLGICADIQIGSNDSAKVEVIQNADGKVIGLKMVDVKTANPSYGAQFNLYFDGVSGVTPASTHWFGHCGSIGTYCFDNLSVETEKSSTGSYIKDGDTYTGLSGCDSGMALSWQNIDLAAGQSQTFSFIVGVGEAAEPPAMDKETPITLTANIAAADNGRTVDVTASVTDADGLTDTLYYSVDGGGEQTVGSVTADGTAQDITGQISLSGLANGEHTLAFWVVNSAGALSPSVTRAVTVSDSGVEGLDAAPAPAHSHAVSVGCETEGGETVTFEPLGDATELAGGKYYYLDDDVTGPLTVTGGTVDLCLNGHSITQRNESGAAIQVAAGATLNLCDCAGGGAVIAQAPGPISDLGSIVVNGALVLYGGKVTANGECQGSRAAILARGTADSFAKVTVYDAAVEAKVPEGKSGTGYAVYLKDYARANISGGSFTASDQSQYSVALTLDSAHCDTTVTGGAFTGDNVAASVGGSNGGTLNIFGGTFNSSTSSALSVQTKGVADITGGVFIGAPGEDAVFVTKRTSTPPASACLSGGIYSTLPEADTDGHLTFAQGKSAQVISAGDPGYQAAYAGYYIVKDTPAPHSHAVSVDCEVDGDDPVEFTPWSTADAMPTEAGNYYLTTNVALADSWAVPEGDTTLCLNGHVLQHTGYSQRTVLEVGQGATLALCDCDTTTQHKFSADTNGCWSLSDEGDKTVTGGAITGGNGSPGGGIRVDGGTMVMYGGNIVGNQTDVYGNSNYGGGGVYAMGAAASFTLHGGRISGNFTGSTAGGGGLRASSSATVTITGGEISENAVKKGDYARGDPKGGGVNMGGSAVLNLSGGSIVNNTVTGGSKPAGGGVAIVSSTFNLSGGPTISGNTPGGVHLSLSWNNVSPITVTGPLTNTTPIGLSVEAGAQLPQLVVKNGKDYLAKFTSDQADSSLAVSGNDLKLATTPPAHTHSWATAWAKSDTHHWHECEGTGTCDVTENSGKNGYAAHDFSGNYLSDAAGHWHKCASCDATDTKSVHAYADDQDTTCNTCGYIRSVTPTPSPLDTWLKNNELSIKGVRVTASNAANILADDPDNNGKVKLEMVDGRATLTLDNANILYRDGYGGLVAMEAQTQESQQLDIRVLGETTLTSDCDVITGASFYGKAHFRIEGGTLNLKAIGEESTGIYTSGTLTVAGAGTVLNIEVASDEWSAPVMGKDETFLQLEDSLAVTEPAKGVLVHRYSTRDWLYSDGEGGYAHKLIIQKSSGDVPTPPPGSDGAEVSGSVTDHDAPVADATVKLMKGREVVKETTTDMSGAYTFTDVAPGDYNVVAVKDGKTMTILVNVAKADLADQNLTMPADSVSSVLDVKENTPAVVVGGLETEAEANAQAGKTVTVTMTVESKKETDADAAADIAKLKEAAPGKTLAFLAVMVEKTVDDEAARPISETAHLLTIVIPFDTAGKKGIAVYRCHGDAAEALSANTADEEHFTAGDGVITVYAKKFSTYAIGYTEETTPSRPSRPSGGVQRPVSSWTAPLPFVDVKATDPFYQAVKYVYEKGWMLGTSDTTFTPGGELTRAMLATVLYRMAGSPKVTGAPQFEDTKADQWYSDAVVWASQTQVLRGYGNGQFGPEDAVSKEMLNMVAARQQGQDPTWTGDPALALPATRAEIAQTLAP